MFCLVSCLLLLTSIPTIVFGANKDAPATYSDEPGFIGLTLIVNRSGWAAPLIFEGIRKPVGEIVESSRIDMERWETSYYLGKYDRIKRPSGKSHCAGEVMHFLSKSWLKDPQAKPFPLTKMNTDYLIDILRALNMKEEDRPPEAGDVIFWAKENLAGQGDRTPGVNRSGLQHFARVLKVLPNGNFIMESKDGNQSVFHVEMPADLDDLWKGSFLTPKWTDDTLLKLYKGVQRYRPLDMTDVKVTWRYWVPPSVNTAGYWVNNGDPNKIYRLSHPEPKYASQQLPIVIVETFGAERQLRGGFQDGNYFFAQEFGADETAATKRMAKYTKDKIEWLAPLKNPGSGTYYRDVLETWVRTSPYLALRKIERWVECYNATACGGVGSDKVELDAASGSIDICFWQHWEDDTKYRKVECSVFYSFPPLLPFEKEGYTYGLTLPVTAELTSARFSAAGSMAGDHSCVTSLSAEEVSFGKMFDRLTDGVVHSMPQPAGNFLTTFEPIKMQATHKVYGKAVGDSVVVEIRAHASRSTGFSPSIPCFLRATYDVVPSKTAAPVLAEGGSRAPIRSTTGPPRRTGQDPYEYKEVTIISVKNPGDITVRLSPNSKKFKLDANTKTLPEYAEIWVGIHGGELIVVLEDPNQPGRKVQVTLGMLTHVKLNELWPNLEHDRASVSFDQGAIDVEATSLGSGVFRVLSPATTTDVTGTRFRAEHDPESNTTRVAVAEGSVVTTPTNTALAPVTLTKDQQVDVTPSAVGAVQRITGEPLVSSEGGAAITSDPQGEIEEPGTAGTPGDSPGGLPEDYPEDWRSQLPPGAQVSGMEDEDEPAGEDWPTGDLPPDEVDWHEETGDGVTVIGGPDDGVFEDFPEDFPGDLSDDYPGEASFGSVDEIIAQLRDPDPERRFDAGIAIAEIGEDAVGAIPVLLDLLGESDSMTRMAGLIGLTGIGPMPEAVAAIPKILPLLEDPENMIRSDAALFLGDLASVGSAQQKSAVKAAMQRLLNDPSEQVRESAESALEMMGE